MKGIVILCALSFLMTQGWVEGKVWASSFDELTEEQKSKVQNGEQVLFIKDVEDSYWPRVTVFQRIESTPEQAAAVYADYEMQKKYIPKMTRSSISSRVDRAVAIVDYRMDVNFMVTVNYSTKNGVSAYDGGRSFKIDQTLVKSKDLKALYVELKFEELGSSTLMRYDALVSPQSSMASSFREEAIAFSKDGGNALTQWIQKERIEQPRVLERQVEALRAALSEKASYCWLGVFCIDL